MRKSSGVLRRKTRSVARRFHSRICRSATIPLSNLSLGDDSPYEMFFVSPFSGIESRAMLRVPKEKFNGSQPICPSDFLAIFHGHVIDHPIFPIAFGRVKTFSKDPRESVSDPQNNANDIAATPQWSDRGWLSHVTGPPAWLVQPRDWATRVAEPARQTSLTCPATRLARKEHCRISHEIFQKQQRIYN